MAWMTLLHVPCIDPSTHDKEPVLAQGKVLCNIVIWMSTTRNYH